MRKLASLFVAFALTAVSATAAFAVSDTENANTTVDVNAAIALTGVPALIDFGAGVPGDTTSAPEFTANVYTNNASGYDLKVTFSDMTGPGADIIGADNASFAVTTSATGATAAGGNVANSSTALTLGTSTDRSEAAGDDFDITASLDIPFVSSGTYNGTAAFVASTL